MHVYMDVLAESAGPQTVCTYTPVDMHIHTHIHIHIHTHMLYIYMYICTYTCMYIPVHSYYTFLVRCSGHRCKICFCSTETHCGDEPKLFFCHASMSKVSAKDVVESARSHAQSHLQRGALVGDRAVDEITKISAGHEHEGVFKVLQKYGLLAGVKVEHLVLDGCVLLPFVHRTYGFHPTYGVINCICCASHEQNQGCPLSRFVNGFHFLTRKNFCGIGSVANQMPSRRIGFSLTGGERSRRSAPNIKSKPYNIKEV
jgi:hypothetical protein